MKSFTSWIQDTLEKFIYFMIQTCWEIPQYNQSIALIKAIKITFQQSRHIADGKRMGKRN